MARSWATPSTGRMEAARFAALLLSLAASDVQGQPASLVADIAQGQPLSSGFFDFIPFSSPTVTIGGSAYFFADDDGIHGAELWRTDGTPGGTGLFVDVNPGPATSSLSLLVASSTQLFFRANDGSSGDVLWRTDGSLGGTWPLPAVFPSGISA